MKLVWKILKSNISPMQLIGFSLANLLGIMILMLTVQFHHDTWPSLSGQDSLVEKDYLVVSKKAGFISSLMGAKTCFEDEEISKLQNNEKITDLGCFKASNFDVYASLEIAGNKVSSDIFFESVPDRFVDADNFEWNIDSQDTTIPIMIPKEYLDLYNFGFSQSQGLPQLSESVLKSLVLNIRLRGNGKTEYLNAQVTGFSKYLNTVLVPESFMDWANERFAPDSGNKTARVLLSVENPNDIELIESIKSGGYEIAQNKESYSKLTFFLNIVTAIILVIGFIISLLSFFILTLSIWLLIEKNQTKINALNLLGYKSKTIAFPYAFLLGVVDLVTVGLGTIAVACAKSWYSLKLHDIISIESGLGYTYAVAALIFVIIALLHFMVLMMTIKKVYKKN